MTRSALTRSPLVVPLVTALLAGAAGYAGGRAGLIGSIINRLKPQTEAAQAVPEPFPLPAGLDPRRSFASINSRLDTDLLVAVEQGGHWDEQMLGLRVGDIRRFQASHRTELSGHLGSPDSLGGVPRVRVIPWRSVDSLTLSLVELEGVDGVSLLCVLIEPPPEARPRPALLVLHGGDATHRSLLEDVDYHHGFGMSLARAGFVVFAPLMPGSRRGEVPTLVAKSTALGRHWETVALQQLYRATDYLASLPTVDRDRIGAYGISTGGRRALRLGAMDERFSLVVVDGEISDRLGWLFRARDSMSTGSLRTDMPFETSALLFPGMGPLFDDMNLISLVLPRQLIISVGRLDPHHPGATTVFERARRLDQVFGPGVRAHLVVHDGGHETAVARVLPLLDAWRRPRRDD